MEERIKCKFYGRGCKRTFKREPGETSDTEVVCSRHWKILDPDMRRRHSQIKRRYRRFLRKFIRTKNPGTKEIVGNALERVIDSGTELWDKIIAEIDFKLENGFEAELTTRRPRQPKTVSKRATMDEILREAGL